MKMRLAGLRFVIGGHLHIHILPGVGSRCPSFSLSFVGLDLNHEPPYKKRKTNPGRCLWLNLGVKFLFSFDGKSANHKWRWGN